MFWVESKFHAPGTKFVGPGQAKRAGVAGEEQRDLLARPRRGAPASD